MAVTVKELIETRDSALARTRNEILNKQGSIQEDLTLLQQSIEGKDPGYTPGPDIMQVVIGLEARMKAFCTLTSDYVRTATNKEWRNYMALRVAGIPKNKRDS